MTSPVESQSAWRCPQCASDSIQRVAVLFASATSATVHAGGGLALSSGGRLGIAGGVGASANASLLAGQLAPPVEPKVKRAHCVACGVGGFVLSFVILSLLGVPGDRIAA